MGRHGNHCPYRIYKNQKNQIGSSPPQYRSAPCRHSGREIILRVFSSAAKILLSNLSPNLSAYPSDIWYIPVPEGCLDCLAINSILRIPFYLKQEPIPLFLSPCSVETIILTKNDFQFISEAKSAFIFSEASCHFVRCSASTICSAAILSIKLIFSKNPVV